MKYGFVIEATITLGVEVEADTLEEAIQLAQEAPVQSFCYQCAKGEKDEWTTSGELDCGAPGDCTLVDLHTDDPKADFEQVAATWNEEA
jgi:hypothetical protein